MYPPDINKSEWGFTAEKDGVRCGLSMVKRFSENGYDLIKEKRPFKGFTEFMEAISDNKRMVNKGAVECLINAGAFDTFGTRKALGEALENWQKLIKQFKGKEIVLVLDDKELSIAEKGQREFEALGFYLTVNPIEPYKKQFKGVTPWDDFQEYQRGQGVLVAGVIGTIKPYKSKNGEMAFIEIGCFDHEYSLNVWAEAWKTYKKDLNEGDIVLVKGQKLDEDKVSVGEKDTIKRLNQEAV
jgi:DNA polymerase-3 subunit alpha